jgi:hypothetical protein
MQPARYLLHKVEDTQPISHRAQYTFKSATIRGGHHRGKEDISLSINTPEQVRELEERVVSCPFGDKEHMMAI